MMRAAACSLALTLALLPCLAADNPITNGGFETLDEEGRPVDWQLLGDVSVTDEAHSGDHAALLQRDSAEGLCGLNRVWEPGSGEQGTMLSELTGGVRFWYKAEAASDPDGLVFYVIPMSDEPLEMGGMRAGFTIPPQHVGDGQWHEGALAYDYSDDEGVRWVHISPRLRGEHARLLLDDIRWVEHVGPVPAIEALEIREVEGREGDRCTVEARLKNAGDRPVEAGTAVIELPAGLSVAGEVRRAVESLAPEETASLEWTVAGRRDEQGRILVSFAAGDHTATRALDYSPGVEILGLMVRRSVLYVGQATNVTLTVRNDGHAVVRNLAADLQSGAALAMGEGARRQTLALLRPQAEAMMTWRVRAEAQTPQARLQAAVRAENAEGGRAASALVVGPQMPAVATVPDGPTVTVGADLAVIGNDRLRAVFPRAEFGLGIGAIQRSAPDGWQTVTMLPRVTRLVVDGAEDAPILVYADDARELPDDELPEGARCGLELSAQVADARGANWRVAETVALREGPDCFWLQVTASPDRSAEVLALDGPILLVGEGAPEGTRRLDAIFPGLEWLVAGERSSSSLDIAPEHPHRIRYVPHPHMVTIPMMCARLDVPNGRDATVSYSWDHLRPYAGEMNRPSAMFASPDRFAGRQCTTMGIFAPSMPEHIDMNQRVAHTPLALEAGDEIELAAEVTVLDSEEGETALEAVRDWFGRHGAAEPNPLPHGEDLVDEVEFNMAAYLRSLWNEEQQKWHPSFFGPASWREPRWMPTFLYDMRMGMALAQDSATVERVRRRYERVVELSGLRPVAEDMGFHFAGPASRVLGESDAVAGLIQRQGDDGSWRFHAYVATSGVFKGRDYGELGPDNAAEVGTCARKAWQVLRFARMTGDPRAREAGLRALAFMERFQVPRAAQVWEVPVHTPDILASADACEAYLEGYLVTGDEHYLDRAVYWAWTGLPFLYVWDVEGFEFLKYASIPVFGATWFQGSWFGRPVQWNGLRYAYAVQKLAEYDESLDWAAIARGVTVSGMCQQYTDPEHQALWPDSISAIDRSDSGANFSPRHILQNTYRLMGLRPTPVTAAADTDEGRILVTAAAELGPAEMRAGSLHCEVTYPPPTVGYVIACNISRPEAVLVDGRPAAEVDSPSEAEPPCWRYLQDAALVELRLAESGTHQLEMHGASYRPCSLSPEAAEALGFEFEADAEGWRPTHDLSALEVAGGVLQTTTTGSDPYMVRSNCSIRADEVSRVRVRMALQPGLGGGAQLFWTTADDPTMDEPKSRRFTAVADGQFHELVVEVGDHERWRGTITSVRLDPTGGEPLGWVKIDYIRGE
ncbi:MAG: hypothetical protein U9R79_14110 [Armatimonadota bacterium]|nr:hypothetical protein [Armatimonadota bacterium]